MRVGLGFDLGVSTRDGGVYSAQARALFARMTTKPSGERKRLINRLIQRLKTSGAWAKLDVFYLTAAHAQQAANLNWVANARNLTPVAAPTFTIDRGYLGNASSSYLTTGFDPAVLLGNLRTDDHEFGVWLRSRIAVNVADMGNSLLSVNARSTESAVGFRSAFLTGGLTTASGIDGLGLTSVRRTASNAGAILRAGVLFEAFTTASTALLTSEVFLLARNNLGAGAFSGAEISAAYGGGALSSAQSLSISAGLQEYLQAVGAV